MRLAQDAIEVAGPILRHSPCLTPADLDSIGTDCGPAHAAIVAARSRAEEPQADFGQPASGLDAGADQEAVELSELFFSASANERRLILLNLDYAQLTKAMPMTTQASEVVGRLESAALRHNLDACARELELGLGISDRMARRIVNDELGEPIVVAAKALQASRAVLERILLFINPLISQSVHRVHELATRYDEISLESAQRLIAIWQDADPREQAPQQPQQRHAARRATLDRARPLSSSFARRPLEQRDARLRGSGNDR